MSILTKILGDPHEKYAKKLRPLVDQINALEPEFGKLSDEALRAKTAAFRVRLGIGNGNAMVPDSERGEGQRPLAEVRDSSPPAAPPNDTIKNTQALDNLLPEAFALVREAAKRVLGQRHYDVQIMGGIVLHRGAIAEMKTGEGKTLVSTLPSYLNALTSRGVHLVTVNDYLARRDTVWMGRVYHALGLTVGCITHESAYLYDPARKAVKVTEEPKEGKDLSATVETFGTSATFHVEHEFLRPVARDEAYAADITYGTNNEFGFDYLRDNMAAHPRDTVQRGYHYAIIDEVDSILIDEARTPLIISAPAEESADLYYKFAELTGRLQENEDYNVDEKMKAATLTDAGIAKIEKWLGVGNLYAEGGLNLVRHAEQSLRAHALYHRDKDYVVREGQVIIVDEFTGRMMPGRRWSEGLHQAVEAKEGVKIERESQTLATVTLQNYFRLYGKLAGMTGTAATESEEFHKIYGLEVIVIPTNKPLVRKDMPDRVYRSEQGKWQAVAREIKERHKKGQPVLVGTISIEKNELLSRLLEREGVPHNLLNAKNHEKEAEIIAQAGRKNAVTVATNMAGRGVDIILGGNPPNPEGAASVREFDGLHVIGTERHDSRRIDNQLRGRSGRQGDPGSTQFYVSLEDDLMRIFAGDRVKAIMARFNIPEEVPIESGMVSKSIESAQSKVEQHNFDIRKHLLEYDDVINKHREIIYKKRREIFESHSADAKLREQTLAAVERELEQVVLFHAPDNGSRDNWNIEEILEVARTIVAVPGNMRATLDNIRGGANKFEDAEARTKIIDALMASVTAAYGETERQLDEIGKENAPPAGDEHPMRKIEKALWLRAIDSLWVEHLDAIDHLRRGIGLRAYGQQEPLVAYKKEAYRMFQELQHLIERQVVYNIFKFGTTVQAQIAAQSLLERRGVRMSGAAKTMEKGSGFVSLPEDSGQGKQPVASYQADHPHTGGKIGIMQNESERVKVGRNDPCPCGSGKKYKRCGLINAPEHQV